MVAFLSLNQDDISIPFIHYYFKELNNPLYCRFFFDKRYTYNINENILKEFWRTIQTEGKVIFI
jgi:hypothetical protein